MAPYIGLRFHAASKVLVDARELAKAKRFELKQKAEFNWSWSRREALRKASKLPYLRKARASALRCMQLSAVCSARRNHGKNKMSAKCLLQIICIQSINENFCELEMSWQKFRLSTLMLECWWKRSPTMCKISWLPTRINIRIGNSFRCATLHAKRFSRLKWRSCH